MWRQIAGSVAILIAILLAGQMFRNVSIQLQEHHAEAKAIEEKKKKTQILAEEEEKRLAALHEPPDQSFREYCEQIDTERVFYPQSNLGLYCIAIFLKDIRQIAKQ